MMSIKKGCIICQRSQDAKGMPPDMWMDYLCLNFLFIGAVGKVRGDLPAIMANLCLEHAGIAYNLSAMTSSAMGIPQDEFFEMLGAQIKEEPEKPAEKN